MKTKLFYNILTGIVSILAVLGAIVMFALGSKEIFGRDPVTPTPTKENKLNRGAPDQFTIPNPKTPTTTSIPPISPLLMP